LEKLIPIVEHAIFWRREAVSAFLEEAVSALLEEEAVSALLEEEAGSAFLEEEAVSVFLEVKAVSGGGSHFWRRKPFLPLRGRRALFIELQCETFEPKLCM